MCYNCGCHMPYYDMGNPNNITEDNFKALAKEWKMKTKEVKEIVVSYTKGELKDKDKTHELDHIFKEASKAWGQSLQEAKTKTADLIKRYPS